MISIRLIGVLDPTYSVYYGHLLHSLNVFFMLITFRVFQCVLNLDREMSRIHSLF